MRPFHILLAILITAVWGCNFIFVKFGLNEIPPLLLCSLRFIFACIPGVFFFKRPDVPFKLLVLYGLFTFALQFALLFAGIQIGMPPGLASVVLQTQVFFSLLLAALFLGEWPSPLQGFGGIVVLIGIGLAWVKLDSGASLSGFLLTIAAAASWGAGNLITKKIGRVNPLALVAWGSLISTPFLLLLSLIFEGPQVIVHSLQHLSFTAIGSVLFITYGATWFGYGVWSWLLSRYTVASIVPFSLLVPIFGLFCANFVFNEPLQPWKLSAGGLILFGMSIHIFGPRLMARYQKRPSLLPTDIADIGG